MKKLKQILVYDSDCNMCSRFIKFIVYFNRNPHIFITDFKSNWYKNTITDNKIDSIIFVSDDKKYIYSDAIIYLLSNINIYFKPLILLKLIPKFIRDNIYILIARNRKKIWNSNHCTMPSKKYLKMYIK